MGFLLLLLAPLDWILLAGFVPVELLGRLYRWLLPVGAPPFPICRPECSCVMVTWHGKGVLTQSLPALARALQKHGGNHEIVIIVDHESGDGTQEYLRTHFPNAKVTVADRALYFGAATRMGIKNATRDIVLLLNNDTIVDEDFLQPLLQVFTDPQIFGVASRVLSDSGDDPETGRTVLQLHAGDFVWSHQQITAADEQMEFCPVSWLHRGAYAIDRRKYLWMGGLDRLYDPLYFEDADLSYRAWKIGWKCVLALKSCVSHLHRLEVPEASGEFLHTLVQRNSYMFFWKNITDMRLMSRHFLRATWKRARRAEKRTTITTEVHALTGALKRLPHILKSRIRFARMITRKDESVIAGVAAACHEPMMINREVH